jgi:hypothetical protein
LKVKAIAVDKVGKIPLQNDDIDWAIKHINERISLAVANEEHSTEIGFVCAREKLMRIIKELFMNGYYVNIIDTITENAILCEISWRMCHD